MEIRRVFVSSTYEDLKDYREAVGRAVSGLDLVADDMSSWSADGRAPRDRSVDGVAQADVVVLLVAHRYGHVPAGEEHSVVELEYQAAREHGIPVLAFLLDGDVPWPPRFIDWSTRAQLDRFVGVLRAEVTCRTFTTPDELATQVTQALSTLAARQTVGKSETNFEPRRRAATPGELRTQPDVLVEIGTAADGLPLLLDVRRARDRQEAQHLLDLLRRHLVRHGPPTVVTELDAFQRGIERAAHEAAAATNFHRVTMLDRTSRTLFVAPTTVARMFTSCLADLLASADVLLAGEERTSRTSETLGRHAASGRMPTLAGTIETPASTARGAYGAVRAATRSGPVAPRDGHDADSDQPRLQSAGGSNRFLAVDPERGTSHCVGLEGSRYVEWRPFVFENLVGVLPDAELTVECGSKAVKSSLSEAPSTLAAVTKRSTTFGRNAVSVARHDILGLLGDVADAVQELHGEQHVHGDLKPHNILLGRDGPVLIDGFDVPVGKPSPGWTPGWSAPEQALGLPVGPQSDVYALGVMVARAVGAMLVGEVRTYRGLHGGTHRDFEFLHDPVVVFPEDRSSTFGPTAESAWKSVIQTALRFEPENRMDDAGAFSDRMTGVLSEFHTHGRVDFAPAGRLTTARLVGGADQVVRVVGLTDAAFDADGVSVWS